MKFTENPHIWNNEIYILLNIQIIRLIDPQQISFD